MSEKKVYGLGQWLECHGNIGRVIAKSIGINVLEYEPEFANDEAIVCGENQGRGYCVLWGYLSDGDRDAFGNLVGSAFVQERRRWLREDTIQDQRYKAIECPLKPVPASIGGAEIQPAREEPEQLQITMNVDIATKAFLREQVASGEKARDILRAMGEAA